VDVVAVPSGLKHVPWTRIRLEPRIQDRITANSADLMLCGTPKQMHKIRCEERMQEGVDGGVLVGRI
jgi:hypothetical protein